MVRILSFGAGVQTTALLLKDPKRYDYVVFADVGDEKPETYKYLEEYIKPFCEVNKINFVTVRNPKWDSLMAHCLENKIIPTRSFRWCTSKFKISPIRKFAKSLGATRKNPFYQDIGISFDESHRLGGSKYDVKYLVSEFPLAWEKITREDCYKIIKDAGFPVPPKSGCYYCPFAKKQEFIDLKRSHPELWDKAEAMEKNNSRYPEITLKNKPMEHLLDGVEINKKQATFDEMMESCDSGHCFV